MLHGRLEWGGRTPGPTPAMMAIGFDIVGRCEAIEKRRVVGCIGYVEAVGSDCCFVLPCHYSAA